MLADLLSDGPLPVVEALRFGAGLAEALRRIHERGSVYGALDPARVAVSEKGVELLPAASCAEISYAAPEQLEGKQADPRSDVFALGAVLYEMLTGHKAFAGDTREGPPPLDGIAPPLAYLLGQCLEVRPERRLQRVQLALIQLKLLETIDARSHRSPAAEPRFKQVEKIAAPAPPSQGVCPQCHGNDVRQSRPKGGLEEGLGELGAKFGRCYRCYHRFMRVGFLSFKRPG